MTFKAIAPFPRPSLWPVALSAAVSFQPAPVFAAVLPAAAVEGLREILQEILALPQQLEEPWLFAILPCLTVLAHLLLWRILAPRRAALGAGAARAAERGAKLRRLARFAVAASIPVLPVLLIPVLWQLLARPPAAELRFMQALVLPLLTAALAQAVISLFFTALAAWGRVAERDTTRSLPPQGAAIAAALTFAALLREGSPQPWSGSDLLGLGFECLAALIALRAVLQQKHILRQLLRIRSRTPDADPPTLPERLTAALADHWHIFAIAFILLSLAGRFGFFGADWQRGIHAELSAGFAIMLAAGLAVVLAEQVHALLLRRLKITSEQGLRDRLALRLGRVLRTGVQIAVVVFAGTSIVNLFSTGDHPLASGGRILRLLSTTLLALWALWFIWTLVDAVLDWSASRAAGPGTRMRTLLPFLRNFAFVVVAVLAVMSVLSNLGVDVAPLLAGAGVAGIAIGIGAQRLVGDVITGIFIIFEDSIAIGETVEAAGKTGVVEGLTIRTLRLRDGDGALHSIPFSSISTLKNSSRGYSAYTFTATILKPEDTDRALEALRLIGEDISADPKWARIITGPFSLWGVDSVTPGGVVLRGNIRARPNDQWGLGREINRRIALRFAALGIAQVQPPLLNAQAPAT
ncbi:mechanosensitive ion channel family protein [Falsigemmobacter intermedius]|uniref:mechanosensitive ion channel family protein n=1 Tax=Falsigemmobacter intermedius TaxID=1553448 RepID=UPI003F05E08A